jgi:hypothetical protein
MTSGSASAKPAASTSTPEPSSTTTDTSSASDTTSADDDTAPIARRLIEEDKSSDDDKADKSSDDDSKPKSADEVTKSFIRLGKREQKLKTRQKEWNEAVAKKEAEHAARDADFAKARQELITENSRLTALQRQIREKHEWVAKGQQAWDNDDPVGFAKAVEKMGKGASLAQITRWLAGAGDRPKEQQRSAEPSQEEQTWRAEKAEWERQRAADAAKGDSTKKQREEAKQRDEAKGRLASAFVSHPFLKNPDDPKKPDPDALDEAFEKIRGAMKHRRPGETAKEVAKRTLDELHAREVRKLKRLGLEPKTETKQSKGKDEKKGDSSKPGERLPEPPATNRDAKPMSLDATRAARIAHARRLTEQQRRGVVS